ncbi:basic-leucine zipper domain-containing protein [Artemisia annua]|uniref:Basic-leucine zipper domain-containing protein n=1 Tax=Artemisia annua TaxID=35608 RepID=A0A2U1M405_ARTAN|nr:basic-leucine zipper domain-containing protein [Artemisia annua]
MMKRKSMISNKESARRSRIRKKKHADDLLGHVNQLVSDNKYIAINLKDTTHMFLTMESENSVLRAQLAELNKKFELLTITEFNSASDNHENEESMMCRLDDDFLLHIDNMLHEYQPFMVDMLLN